MTDTKPILVSDHTAAGMFGISRATFWRRVEDETFPKPIRIGGVTRWRHDKLMEAIERLSDDGGAHDEKV